VDAAAVMQRLECSICDSGSTLIAAQQTGHKAFLMELNALHADVIVQRWEKFTGRKAERIAAKEVAT
jgi:DNA modification methylase